MNLKSIAERAKKTKTKKEASTASQLKTMPERWLKRIFWAKNPEKGGLGRGAKKIPRSGETEGLRRLSFHAVCCHAETLHTCGNNSEF